jgi:hypothetical protein
MIMMISGLPILLVFCYFIGSQYRDKKYEAEREVLSAVQSIAFEHMSHVEGIKNLLIALSQYPDIRLKDSVGCSDILNLVLEKSPSSLNVGVADKEGQVIATGIRQPLPIKYGVSDRKYFKDAVSTKRFSSGEYTVSRAAKKPTPTLHFALPVLDSAGKVELVLYAALDLTRFGKILVALSIGDLPNPLHFGRVSLGHASNPL